MPFEDEMAYGVLARFQAAWAYIDHEGLLEQVLGFKAKTFHPLAAPSLGKLSAECLGDDASALQFIERHTLLPYYAAFAPRAKVVLLEKAMRLDARHLVTSFICRTALSTGQHRFLNVCRDCMDEDAVSGHESYWRRGHQLPGIHRCPVHGTRLWSTGVPVASIVSKKLVRPQDAVRRNQDVCRLKRSFDVTLERQLNSASVQLLQDGLKQATSRIPSYRHVALAIGYRSRRFEVAEQALSEDFTRWLARRCTNFEAIGPSRWWRCLLSGVKGHPTVLQHLLMRCFLAQRLSEQTGHSIGPLHSAIDNVPLVPPSRLWRSKLVIV